MGGLAPMDHAQRWARRCEIDATIARWTASEDPDDVARRLQTLGVEAAPVRTALDLARDPHLAARGFVQTIDHPRAGPKPYPGPPWQLAGVPTAPHAPAPRLGEHTDAALASLGYTGDEIRRLREGGALT